MNAEDLAKMLDGREMGAEISEAEEASARAFGLVVVFGYSDDNVEFRGAIRDEIPAYNGRIIPVTRRGIVKNDCSDEDCPYYLLMRKVAPKLRAIWSDEGPNPPWTYGLPWPHSTFNVMEDREVFCRGVVFALADVPTSKEARRG